MKTLPCLTLFVVFLTFGCSRPPAEEPATKASVPNAAPIPTDLKQMPEFELEKIAGGTLKSADLKGKVVIVDFWATWCTPCIQEVPNYNALSAKYAGKGAMILGMTMESGSLKEVQPKVAKFKMEYPIVMGTDEVEKGFGGTIGYPTTFVVTKDGKIYKKILGIVANKRAVLEKDIEKLLAAESTPASTRVY